MPSEPEKPSEAELIRKRLTRLEVRVRENALAASRARVTTAGFAGGAVALFLSLSVPWVRDEIPWELAIDRDGSLSLGDVRAFATGWELMGEAVAETQGMLIVAFLALLALLVVAVIGPFAEAKPLFVTAQVLAVAVPLLLLFSWPPNAVDSDVAVGPGPAVATVACVVICATAQWAKHKDARFPDY